MSLTNKDGPMDKALIYGSCCLTRRAASPIGARCWHPSATKARAVCCREKTYDRRRLFEFLMSLGSSNFFRGDPSPVIVLQIWRFATNAAEIFSGSAKAAGGQMRKRRGWRPGSQREIDGPDFVAPARRLLSRLIHRLLSKDQRCRSFRAGSCA